MSHKTLMLAARKFLLFHLERLAAMKRKMKEISSLDHCQEKKENIIGPTIHDLFIMKLKPRKRSIMESFPVRALTYNTGWNDSVFFYLEDRSSIKRMKRLAANRILFLLL